MTRKMLWALLTVTVVAGLLVAGPVTLAADAGGGADPVPVPDAAEQGVAGANRAAPAVPDSGETETSSEHTGRPERDAPDGGRPQRPEISDTEQRLTDPNNPEAGEARKVQTYDLAGSNPGSDAADYAGTVTLSGTGPVVKVTWKIGERIQTGVGFINGPMLAVSFPMASGMSGVCLFARNPETGVVTGFRAVATPEGGVWGRETWTPPKAKAGERK